MSIKSPPVSDAPSVRLARPAKRPIQLRYTCPHSGRSVRVSTGTRNEQEAEQQRKELEAKLLLGLSLKVQQEICDENMAWSNFRVQYREIQLATMREKSAIDADSRLDLAERIVRPRTLADMNRADALHLLQTKLRQGAYSRCRPPRPRAIATTRSYLKSVRAALNWARHMGYVTEVPGVKLVVGDKNEDMKGRPLTNDEYASMLGAIPLVVGERAAPSWRFLLEGVVSSGLRLEELLSISWDIAQTIQPRWCSDKMPVLWFPAHLQKNSTSQEIPLSPWFERLLLDTAKSQRVGWIFNPLSLESKRRRHIRTKRLTAKHVGRVVSRIGKRAGVIVDEGDPTTGAPAKYASSHDLRRTFAQRLVESALPKELVRRLMRHADIKTTERFYLRENTQREAAQIHEFLRRNGAGTDGVPKDSGYTLIET